VSQRQDASNTDGLDIAKEYVRPYNPWCVYWHGKTWGAVSSWPTLHSGLCRWIPPV